MKNVWLNPKYESEADATNKLFDYARKKVDSMNKTPMKDNLDKETQEYLSGQFPKTNDDSLQEDFAKTFLFDSQYLDKLYERQNKGERMEKKVIEELWNLYEKQMRLGGYLDVYKDINKRVDGLINNMNVLKAQVEIEERFPMAKSGISNKEAMLLAKAEAENIKNELDTIHDDNVSKESVGELLDKYERVVERYYNLWYVIPPEHPEQN